MNRLHLALFACVLTLPAASAMADNPHALAATASPAAAACEPTPTNTKSGPAKGKEILSINDEDPGMQAAFCKARATLDAFLSVVKSANPKIDNMAVKVQFRQGKLVDYLWVLPFTPTDQGFRGYVNNISGVIKTVEAGQEVDFTRADIVDWMYVDTTTSTMYGNFTTCAMMVDAPPAERQEMKNRYGLDCSKP